MDGGGWRLTAMKGGGKDGTLEREKREDGKHFVLFLFLSLNKYLILTLRSFFCHMSCIHSLNGLNEALGK